MKEWSIAIKIETITFYITYRWKIRFFCLVDFSVYNESLVARKCKYKLKLRDTANDSCSTTVYRLKKKENGEKDGKEELKTVSTDTNYLSRRKCNSSRTVLVSWFTRVIKMIIKDIMRGVEPNVCPRPNLLRYSLKQPIAISSEFKAKPSVCDLHRNELVLKRESATEEIKSKYSVICNNV